MYQITKAEFATYIKNCQHKELFNFLGWDTGKNVLHPLEIDSLIFKPQIIAEKSGFKIVACFCDIMPPYSTRIKIANSLKKLIHESIIIFSDKTKQEQIWLYSYIDKNRNKKVEIIYNSTQDVERLYQRTSGLIFDIDEQENITIVDVSKRVKENFAQNAEKVTKKFYDNFKKQHTALLKFIEGIETTLDKEWYASIMLNRLMFCYFMQKRGFLNKDKNYLRNKLKECKTKLGKGNFYSFYRSFLLILFQKGFGTYEHSPEVIEMIGNIPYLNGGLFDLHEVEQKNPNINIRDEAFENIFNLFDQYEWHLDTRDCSSGNEISPDVLGYIFEKYINDRAQMGAYYTQEDITDYISRSSILPYLLESTKTAYTRTFEPTGAVWTMLRNSGGKYIFESIKKGVDLPLPPDIEIGIDTQSPNLLERRKTWNQTAPSEYALPTEIWREVIERRKRYEEVYSLITQGQIININDFITYNLDITNFVIDLLDTIEDPKFVYEFYKNLQKVTVLDPTCGSGAFLFAALSILEPLYDSCLNRMSDYLSHNYKGILERSIAREFDKWLELMENEIHPNKQYFIYKSIILNNLYGVDIMREAAETAKLRLFLKLVSTANPDYRQENIGIEPLPDIDFNIKVGNTLIGFANEEEMQQAFVGNFFAHQLKGETMEAMYSLAKAVSRYKQLQLGEGDYKSGDFKTAKKELTGRQAKLKEGLDKLLKEQLYPTVPEGKWQTDYMPFHWVAEFYSIIVENKGFDVIIGNPPYVEYSSAKNPYQLKNYETEKACNLYAYVIERSKMISENKGIVSMIIPISAFSNDSMKSLQIFCKKFPLQYISSYHQRPAGLFEGVLQRLSIFIGFNDSIKTQIYTSKVYRWYANTRNLLFQGLAYQASPKINTNNTLKIGNLLEYSIASKLYQQSEIGKYLVKNSNNKIHYRTAGGGYWVTFLNSAFETQSLSNKSASFSSDVFSEEISALLNSNLFWMYYVWNFDQFNFKDYMIFGFRYSQKNSQLSQKLKGLSARMENSLLKNSTTYVIHSKTRGDNETINYHKYLSKAIMDEIDIELAQHYGFTQEELDYIINYDIKYRMGGETTESDDEQTSKE